MLSRQSHCLLNGCAVKDPIWERVRYNHYRTRSFQDFRLKEAKGVVQGQWERKHRTSTWEVLDRNEERDEAIQSFVPLIRARLEARFPTWQTPVQLVLLGPPLSHVQLTVPTAV